MTKKRTTGVVAACVAAAMWMCGCQSRERPLTPEERQQVFNQARFDAVQAPSEVRVAFRRQYPTAAVTDVQLQPTPTGTTLYKVVYVDRGTPGNVTYRSDGVAVVRAP